VVARGRCLPRRRGSLPSASRGGGPVRYRARPRPLRARADVRGRRRRAADLRASARLPHRDHGRAGRRRGHRGDLGSRVAARPNQEVHSPAPRAAHGAGDRRCRRPRDPALACPEGPHQGDHAARLGQDSRPRARPRGRDPANPLGAARSVRLRSAGRPRQRGRRLVAVGLPRSQQAGHGGPDRIRADPGWDGAVQEDRHDRWRGRDDDARPHPSRRRARRRVGADGAARWTPRGARRSCADGEPRRARGDAGKADAMVDVRRRPGRGWGQGALPDPRPRRLGRRRRGSRDLGVDRPHGDRRAEGRGAVQEGRGAARDRRRRRGRGRRGRAFDDSPAWDRGAPRGTDADRGPAAHHEVDDRGGPATGLRLPDARGRRDRPGARAEAGARAVGRRRQTHRRHLHGEGRRPRRDLHDERSG
jgi:hypothetical protein